MGKSPAFQFYPGDWFREPGLRACSLKAKGLWIEMLCVMFDCTPKGYLTFNGGAPSDEDAARMLRTTVEEYVVARDELVTRHVVSCDDHGILFCRRMVREADRKELEKQGSRIRSKRYRQRKKGIVTERHGRSSSSSSSSSSKHKEKNYCAEVQNVPPAPTVISIPILKGEYPVTQEQVDEWKLLFPAVDILQALRNIRAWNLANPKNRKTARGVLRHVTHWLATEQNRAPTKNVKAEFRIIPSDEFLAQEKKDAERGS